MFCKDFSYLGDQCDHAANLNLKTLSVGLTAVIFRQRREQRLSMVSMSKLDNFYQ